MAEFTKEPTKIQKIIAERKKNTAARNEKIRDRFNHLYNVDRKRYDDVIEALKDEFNLAQSTIETALKGS